MDVPLIEKTKSILEVGKQFGRL